MGNLLLDPEPVEYKIQETSWGVWKRYLYPSGARFAEFKSRGSYLGYPLLHYTYGICPETGGRIVAKGVVAVGRIAMGGVALGQAAFGIVALGQLSVGLVLGLGQAAFGIVAVGQLAVAAAFALGQFAAAAIAIGQLALGKYVLAQVGVGAHVWAQHNNTADPAAVEFFKGLWAWFAS